ncbi:NADPH oxidase 5 [Channa argus]|uniref:NADPH oxidase 5 n=1 Tax=Channa argus TaxID=215402 RepID=A0A6G1QUN5_CHAAH|nr:NADPH oxidase 5 [Channa argus]
MSVDEDSRWLEWVTKQFESIAGDDKEINLEEFKTALKVKERFFALFDSDGSSSISLDELLKALDLLIHGSETDKLKFLFQVYDVDGSGSIDPDELKTVLKSCLRESAISLPEEKLDDLTLALFESADKDNSGSITFEELKAELEAFPEVMENLTISAANWLKPPDLDQKKRQTPRYLTRSYWHKNSRKLLFLCMYTCLNVLLFVGAMLYHRPGGGWYMVAKGCGQCLNFNCTFVMVLMLRRCLTWLRATWVVRVLPLDQNILLHQIVGCAILGFSVVHTAAHVFNFGTNTHLYSERTVRLSESGDYSVWEYLLTTSPGIGWVKGSASVTGVVLQFLICLMVLCSSTFVFYWSHLSYIWVWALLVVHCANFWKWFVVPGLVFLLEKIVGIAISRMGGLYIVEVSLLPSKVTHLVLRRPQFFHFKPGDYVYINIPVIAKYEWHPFTISSAPEQPGAASPSLKPAQRQNAICPADTLWLHIRSMGQWTNRLYEYFRQPVSETVSPRQLATSLRKRRQLMQTQEELFNSADDNGAVASNEDDAVELTMYRQNGCHSGVAPIQGPGEPLSDALGPAERGEAPPLRDVRNNAVGVTAPFGIPEPLDQLPLLKLHFSPFRSLPSWVRPTGFATSRYRRRKQNCPNCNYSWCENIKDSEMKLRKVDFIWINRDQKSFEWFVSLLTKLEMDQADEEPEGRFLEMHMYMTSALSKNDMKAIGLQMALDLLAKKEKRDSITGLRTRTQPGRPEWGKVFQKLSEENKGKVHVFYCGAPALAKVIKAQCEHFGFNFYKENF